MPTFSGEVAIAATDTAVTVAPCSIAITKRIKELWNVDSRTAQAVFGALSSTMIWATEGMAHTAGERVMASLIGLRRTNTPHSEAMIASEVIVYLMMDWVDAA